MTRRILQLISIIVGSMVVILFFSQNAKANSSRVETINYRLKYRDREYRKSALVYLPAGYERSRRYNVLYMMHGSTETPREFFNDGHFQQRLDKQIAAGQLQPSIVVFPTYYPSRNFVSSNYYRDKSLNRAFAQHELIQDLVPAVEGHYRTFAKGTSAQALQASRQHRAFGGFSMGAITTWYVFQSQLPYFADYLPVAGDSWTVKNDGGACAPQQTAQRLAQTAHEHPQLDFHIFAGVGRNDGTSASMTPQIRVMHRLPAFSDDRLQYYHLPAGTHSPQTTSRIVMHYANQLFR